MGLRGSERRQFKLKARGFYKKGRLRVRQDKLLRVIEWERCERISRPEVEGCVCLREDKHEAIMSATVHQPQVANLSRAA